MSLELKIRSVDADNVWMEVADDEGALALALNPRFTTQSIFSLMPEFITRRLMPQRLVVLPHESYLTYTQSRSSRYGEFELWL